MNGDIGSVTIRPDQMTALNPVMILIFIPLFQYVFYPLLAKIGINKPLRKMVFGGTLAAISYVISGIIELLLDHSMKVHILWQIPQNVVLTLGEVMFSITGLEFSFTEAPNSMKSVLQGCWLLTIAFGNLLVILIASFHFESQTIILFLFAAFMFADMAAFSYIAYKYKPIPLDEVNKVAGDSEKKP
jgi:dipeptide/tripeptide permease